MLHVTMLHCYNAGRNPKLLKAFSENLFIFSGDDIDSLKYFDINVTFEYDPFLNIAIR